MPSSCKLFTHHHHQQLATQRQASTGAKHQRLARRPRTAVATAQTQPAGQQLTAVISGSSTGIGRATALELASLGWRVFAGVRTEADEQAVGQLHPGITPLRLDVTSQESIAAAQQQVAATAGHVNALINNAGIGLVVPAEYVPLQQFRLVLEVNLLGPLAMCQAFVPLLRQAGPQRGRIINVSSTAGHMALPFFSAYNASKAGLDILTDCLRYELQPQGVPVVLIKPGPVATPIWSKSTATSQAVVDGLPAEWQQLYGAQFEKMREVSAKTAQGAASVDEVVRVLSDAATAQQPKATYIVGKNAALGYWAKRLLPDAVWRGMMQKVTSVE